MEADRHPYTHEDPEEIISAQVNFELLNNHGEVADNIPSTILYDTSDKAWLTVRLETGRDTIYWNFGRELLRDGLERPVGEGEVRVRPFTYRNNYGEDEKHLILELYDHKSQSYAVLRTPADEIAHYVDKIFDAVPAGEEFDLGDLDQKYRDYIKWTEE